MYLVQQINVPEGAFSLIFFRKFKDATVTSHLILEIVQIAS